MDISRTAGGLMGIVGLACLIFAAPWHEAAATGTGLLTIAGIGLTTLSIGLFVGSIGRIRGPGGRWLLCWRIVRAVATAVVVMSLLMTITVYIHSPPEADQSDLIGLAFAAVFAGGVGFAELTGRYRDDPARLFTAAPTMIYVSVNVAAAVAALALIKEFRVFDPAQPHRAVYEVLLAGFGSIAFFRSSLFTARVGGTDVDIGPSTLLRSLLVTSELMINRSQARDRADDAAAIMQQVDFTRRKPRFPHFASRWSKR